MSSQTGSNGPLSSESPILCWCVLAALRQDLPWPWKWRLVYLKSSLPCNSYYNSLICISSQVLSTVPSNMFSVIHFCCAMFWFKNLQRLCINLQTKLSLQHSSRAPAPLSLPASPLPLSSLLRYTDHSVSRFLLGRLAFEVSHRFLQACPVHPCPTPSLFLIDKVSVSVPLL